LILSTKKYLFFFSIILLLIVSSCKDKEVFTGVEDERPEAFGKLFIESSPSNARVFLNGKNMGVTTPAVIPYLLIKEYSITLKMDLFQDTTFSVLVKENDETKININYYNNSKVYGKIFVTSTPLKAGISLNNVNTGLVTPDTLKNNFPGFYSVKLSYPEHRPDSATVTVLGGKLTSVNLILEDTTEWVSYNYFNSGIRSNNINCVEVDHNGYVWFGTSSVGPVRFDGKKFEVMSANFVAINRINVTDIYVDNSGAVWVSSSNGLYKYYNNSWTDYSDVVSGYLNTVEVDNAGIAWIASNSKGLIRLENGNAKFYNSSTVSTSIFPTTNVYDLAVEKTTGKVWFTIQGENGVKSFDGTNWNTIKNADMNVSPSIGSLGNKINIDDNGIIWASFLPNPNAGILGGLVYYNGNKWSNGVINGFGVSQIRRITNSGKFNFLCSNFGVAIYENVFINTLLLNRYNSKLPADVINDIVLDKSGNLWFVSLNGAVKLKKGFF